MVKKLAVLIMGLFLVFSFGCSSEENKKAAEKTKEIMGGFPGLT